MSDTNAGMVVSFQPEHAIALQPRIYTPQEMYVTCSGSYAACYGAAELIFSQNNQLRAELNEHRIEIATLRDQLNASVPLVIPVLSFPCSAFRALLCFPCSPPALWFPCRCSKPEQTSALSSASSSMHCFPCSPHAWFRFVVPNQSKQALFRLQAGACSDTIPHPGNAQPAQDGVSRYDCSRWAAYGDCF